MLLTDICKKEKDLKGNLTGMTQVIKLQNMSSCSLNVDKTDDDVKWKGKQTFSLQKVGAPGICQTIYFMTTLMS